MANKPGDYKIKKPGKPKPGGGVMKPLPVKPGTGIKKPLPMPKPGKPTRPGDSIVKPLPVKPGVGTDAQKRAKQLKTLEAQLKKSKGSAIGGGGKKVKRATGMVKTTKKGK